MHSAPTKLLECVNLVFFKTREDCSRSWRQFRYFQVCYSYYRPRMHKSNRQDGQSIRPRSKGLGLVHKALVVVQLSSQQNWAWELQ
jgi:hypothetical protein